jgi:uncharacterized membrane protein
VKQHRSEAEVQALLEELAVAKREKEEAQRREQRAQQREQQAQQREQQAQQREQQAQQREQQGKELTLAHEFVMQASRCAAECATAKLLLEQQLSVSVAKSISVFQPDPHNVWNADDMLHADALADVAVVDAKCAQLRSSAYCSRVHALFRKQRQKKKAQELRHVHPIAEEFSAAVFEAAFPRDGDYVVADVCRYSEELVRRSRAVAAVAAATAATRVTEEEEEEEEEANIVINDDDDDDIESVDERAKDKIYLDRMLMRWPDVLLFRHVGDDVGVLNRCTQEAAFLSFEWKRRMLSKRSRPTVDLSEAVSCTHVHRCQCNCTLS